VDVVYFIVVNCAVALMAGAVLGWRLRRLSIAAGARRTTARDRCVAAAAARAGWAANAIATLRWYAWDRPALLAGSATDEQSDPRVAAQLLAAATRGDDHVEGLGRRDERVSVDAVIGLAGEALEPYGVRLEAPAGTGSGAVPGSAVGLLTRLLAEVADRTRAVRIIGVSDDVVPALTIDRSDLHEHRLRQWRDNAVARLTLTERTLTVPLLGEPR